MEINKASVPTNSLTLYHLSEQLLFSLIKRNTYLITVTQSFKNVRSFLVFWQGFGYISWIIFIVDIYLLYKLYRQQSVEEVGHPQQAGQPGVIQQPAVVIVPQGAKQQVYQPPTHPGQQPVQYPGQQPVLMGMPPPAYRQQPPQGETQK